MSFETKDDGIKERYKFCKILRAGNNMKVFISGHLDLTEDEFNYFYKDKIDLAISLDSEFILGDAKGADTMAQTYLSERKYSKVVVYHMFNSPRNNVGNFPTKGGYISDEERDKAMTNDSNSDIAFIRKGREKSGTAKNLLRRMKYEVKIF